MKNINRYKIGLIISMVLLLSACPNQTEEPSVDKIKDDNSKPKPHVSDVQYIHVGPNWAALQKIKTQDSKFKLSSTIKNNFVLDEEINLTIKSERTGKLWVVFVDPNDAVTLMYPNHQVQDNTINAGVEVKLPGSIDNGWAIKAGEPFGQSIVSFIVTTGDVNLNDVLATSEKSTMEKALILVNTSNQWSINTHVVTVSDIVKE